MTVVLIALVVLALVFIALGVIIEAATWALIIALVLAVAGLFAGFIGRRGAKASRPSSTSRQSSTNDWQA